MALAVKNWPAHAGDTRDMHLIPGSGRSPGEGNSNPLQYSLYIYIYIIYIFFIYRYMYI